MCDPDSLRANERPGIMLGLVVVVSALALMGLLGYLAPEEPTYTLYVSPWPRDAYFGGMAVIFGLLLVACVVYANFSVVFRAVIALLGRRGPSTRRGTTLGLGIAFIILGVGFIGRAVAYAF